MAVPKSKYVKSKYVKSKYVKSKYVKSKYISIYKLVYSVNMYPYNVKLNHLLSKIIINTNNYNTYLTIFLKIKLKNYYYKNIDIMYLKKQQYRTNCKYYQPKNKLRYMYKFI